MGLFDKYRKPNGKYNGVAMMAELSGLSQDEIKWTWERMKQLVREGKSTDEAARILAEEVKQTPWQQPAPDTDPEVR